MRNILTTRQVAEELGVKIGAVYSYIREGTLKAYKIGGYSKRRHWRIKRTDFEVFINRGAEQNTLGRSKNANQGQVAVSAPHCLGIREPTSKGGRWQ